MKLPNINLVIGRRRGKYGFGLYRSPSSVIFIAGPRAIDIRQWFKVAYAKDVRKGLVKHRDYEE